MQKQKKILDETIHNWIGGNYEQVDDILIVAVKI